MLFGHWWSILAPGVGIFLSVYSFMRIGLALEEILNPRMRKGSNMLKVFKHLNNTYLEEVFASMDDVSKMKGEYQAPSPVLEEAGPSDIAAEMAAPEGAAVEEVAAAGVAGAQAAAAGAFVPAAQIAAAEQAAAEAPFAEARAEEAAAEVNAEKGGER